ncbi:hypothetical protein KY347_00925 [Candidatus Woesearchaeota archaeon]|nr:hypothetical protein [Candidatus Woesearchaeota archaeon]
MKQLLAILVALLVMPVAFGAGASTSIGVDIVTEDFEPLVWMCDSRIVLDDPVQPGTTPGDKLIEREQNYAFEGEQIVWEVLVMDKNGINKIEDVFATVGDVQGAGNYIEVNCVEDLGFSSTIDSSCNARILEENLTGTKLDTTTQRYYTCTLTVETDASMYGEYWITVEVTDLDGLSGTMDENEYWFLNPVIALTVDGDLIFEDVRPGTVSYSDTILVGNDADDGSGVRLEMYIAGTNFYDSSFSGAMCPTSNVLDLSNFRYFATNGYYSTANVGGVGPFSADAEGYMGIPPGETLAQAKEIIGTEMFKPNIVSNIGNVLTPGSEMALTFKLSLPEPCNGDFDTGAFYFWGEAI